MASLISQLCGDSLPAVFWSGQDGTMNRLLEHSWISDRLKNGTSVKANC